LTVHWTALAPTMPFVWAMHWAVSPVGVDAGHYSEIDGLPPEVHTDR
jgi:hypothetical protein